MNEYQQAFGFLVNQLARIETQVYEEQFPDVQYPDLVPVDTSTSEWIPTITHYSRTRTGRPGPISGRGTIFPKVSSERRQHHVAIEMEGLGYDYTLQELMRSRMLGMDLPSDSARDCRDVVERRLDEILIYGNKDLGWDSFLYADDSVKSGRPTAVDADNNGSGSGDAKRYWDNKSATQILRDINKLLMGIYHDTLTVEMADTLLVPPNIWTSVCSKFIDGTNESVFDTIQKNNVYTKRTGRPLMIRECRGLEAAGPLASGSNYYGRILAYRKDPSVLRFHIPMPFRFLDPYQHHLLYEVPGIFSTGGLEIRRPAVFRYLDKIAAPEPRRSFPGLD